MSQLLKRQYLGNYPLQALVIAAFLVFVVMAGWGSRSAADDARIIPAPAFDESTRQAPASEVAVLAGGCFWGVQGVFQHVEGVANAVSGYAGGARDTARYETVSTGTTGHAE